MNFSDFVSSLEFMWKGMLGIFCVTAVIISSIYLLNSSTKMKTAILNTAAKVLGKKAPKH